MVLIIYKQWNRLFKVKFTRYRKKNEHKLKLQLKKQKRNYERSKEKLAHKKARQLPNIQKININFIIKH